jgi:hypothetical protein
MKTTNLAGVSLPSDAKLLPADLVVDPNMQRDVVEIHLTRLTADYNPALVGTLVISKRANGANVILDGQHRWLAAKVAAPEDHMKCLVFHGLTPPQEADIFIGFNDSANVDSVAKFRLGVIAGNPDLVAIANVFENAGVDLASNTHASGFGAIATAMRIGTWKQGLKTLYRVLDLLNTVFPGYSKRNQPWRRSIVEGMALLMHVQPDMSDERMIKQIRGRGEEWVGQLIAAATHGRTINGASETHNVASAFIHWYNKDMRGGKGALAQWEFSRRVNTSLEPGSSDVLTQYNRGQRAIAKDAGTPASDEGEHDSDKSDSVYTLGK